MPSSVQAVGDRVGRELRLDEPWNCRPRGGRVQEREDVPPDRRSIRAAAVEAVGPPATTETRLSLAVRHRVDETLEDLGVGLTDHVSAIARSRDFSDVTIKGVAPRDRQNRQGGRVAFLLRLLIKPDAKCGTPAIRIGAGATADARIAGRLVCEVECDQLIDDEIQTSPYDVFLYRPVGASSLLDT